MDPIEELKRTLELAILVLEKMENGPPPTPSEWAMMVMALDICAEHSRTQLRAASCAAIAAGGIVQ